MQACCFTQHSRHTVHRVACKVFLAPDRPISQCLPYSLQDQDLFRGNVPQPADWLRAWRACQTASSFDAAVKYFQTEDFSKGRTCRLHEKSSLDLINVFGEPDISFGMVALGNIFQNHNSEIQDVPRFEADDFGHALGSQKAEERDIEKCVEHQHFCG